MKGKNDNEKNKNSAYFCNIGNMPVCPLLLLQYHPACRTLYRISGGRCSFSGYTLKIWG